MKIALTRRRTSARSRWSARSTAGVVTGCVPRGSSTLQNDRRPFVAQAFRPADGRRAALKGCATSLGLLCASSGPLEKQLALARVARERCRTLELPTRLVYAADLSQEVAAHARQEVIVPKRRLRSERFDELEAGLWTKRHRVRDRAIQIDDRRRRDGGEISVEPHDARPVRGLRRRRSRVAGGDRGLKRVR